MSTTGSTAAVAVVGLNNWTLNMSTDKAEVTAFGAANKAYVLGFQDVTGSLSGFWDSASDALFDGSESTDGVNMYLYPSSDAPSKFFSGPAWVDFSIACPATGAVTISGNFAANGDWSQA
jgi:hypothetical protein